MRKMEKRLRADLADLAEALLEDKEPAKNRLHPPSEVGPEAAFERGPIRSVRRVRMLVAVLSLVGLGLVAAQVGRSDHPTEIHTVSLSKARFGSWAAIADSPLESRAYAATAWTGSEAVFWLGASLDFKNAYADGARYNPRTDTWETLTVPGWGHPSVSTGFLDGSLFVTAKGHGTRFDPLAGTWADLSEPDGMFLGALVSTGETIWGVGWTNMFPTGGHDLAIARYESSTDSWTRGPVLTESEIESGIESERVSEIIEAVGQADSEILWTGTEIVVWNGPSGGISFDPETKRWDVLPSLDPPSGSVEDTHAAVTDAGLTILAGIDGDTGDATRVAMYGTDGWRWLEATVGFDDFETVSIAAAGKWLVAFSAEDAPVVINLVTGESQRMEGSLLDGVEEPNTVWTGTELVVWGGVAKTPEIEIAVSWTPPS